jgi:hypothetical protein
VEEDCDICISTVVAEVWHCRQGGAKFRVSHHHLVTSNFCWSTLSVSLDSHQERTLEAQEIEQGKFFAKGSLLVGGTCEVAARRGGSWSFSAPFVTKNFIVFVFSSRKFSETQREIEEQKINHFLFLLGAGSGTPRSHLISNQGVQL